jgi:hypothetical protein
MGSAELDVGADDGFTDTAGIDLDMGSQGIDAKGSGFDGLSLATRTPSGAQDDEEEVLNVVLLELTVQFRPFLDL